MNRTCTECDRWDPVDGKCAKDGELYHGWEDACDDFVEETDTKAEKRWIAVHGDGGLRTVIDINSRNAVRIFTAMQNIIRERWPEAGNMQALYNIHIDSTGTIQATDGRHVLTWDKAPDKIVSPMKECPSWVYVQHVGLVERPELSDWDYPDIGKLLSKAESHEPKKIKISNILFPEPYRHTWLILESALKTGKTISPKLTGCVEEIADLFGECSSGPEYGDPVMFRNKELGLTYIVMPVRYPEDEKCPE